MLYVCASFILAVLAFTQKNTEVLGRDAPREVPFCKPNTTLEQDLLGVYCVDIDKAPTNVACLTDALFSNLPTSLSLLSGVLVLQGTNQIEFINLGSPPPFPNPPTPNEIDTAITVGCPGACCGGQILDVNGNVLYQNSKQAFTYVNSTVRLSYGQPLPVGIFTDSPVCATCSDLSVTLLGSTYSLQVSFSTTLNFVLAVTDCKLGTVIIDQASITINQLTAVSNDPTGALANLLNDNQVLILQQFNSFLTDAINKQIGVPILLPKEQPAIQTICQSGEKEI